MQAPLFRDRTDAAIRLIAALPPDIYSTWLVLGLPRGGVPIAATIARHLGATHDLVIVRKVGAPENPEVAIAAVTGPADDQIVINRSVQRLSGLTDADVRKLAIRPVQEVEARRRMWASSGIVAPIRGRNVLIVDDGAATGTTLAAAVEAVRRQAAKSIIVALPVALAGALEKLSMADVRVVCLYQPEHLSSVGGAYLNFPQINDAEVAALLSDFRSLKH